LDRLIDVAKHTRKPFMDARKEIRQFAYDKTFDFMYGKEFEKLSFKAKIAKAAEFVEIMGAELYPVAPEAAVNSFEWSTPSQRMRHEVEKKYADYAFRHGDLQTHGTKCVYEALLSGRGVLWTGFNPRKGIVQSVYDSTENLIIDPDARIREEINWVGRKRIKPRWMLHNMWPDKKDAIDKLEKTTEAPSGQPTSYEPASELIEYYEIYSRVGLQNYAPSLTNADDFKDINLGSDPLKYCVSGKTILSVEPWEIPFHEDSDGWPCEMFDPLECADQLWPASPLETGLGHLKALNWIYTLYISKMRVTTRTPLVVAKYNGQGFSDDELVKLLKGDDLDVVRLTINGDVIKLGDLVQQFKFETGVDEFERFVTIVGTAFEKATGLYEVLYTGTTGSQIRNATTADLIRNTSQSRIELMRSRFETFMSKVTRKTLFAARFLEQPQDIARMFGPQAGAAWGTLAPPQMVQQEQAQRAQAKQQVMVSMAQQAGMQQQMQYHQAAQNAHRQGQPVPPPPQQQPNPQEFSDKAEHAIGPEQLVSMEDWLNDAGREILTGSMRKIDPKAQVENINVALNQLAPAVVSLPGGAEFVAHMAVEFARKNKYSLEFIAAAEKFASQAAAVTDMQVAMQTHPQQPPQQPQRHGTPPKGPQSGPQGGHNPRTG
jgi:hypothetical protein